METIIIAIVAMLASCLTLFSGFGLGTLLMPVVALFFPLDVAIGITAIVHFANNFFKLGLLGLKADKNVLVGFGLPAVLAAFAGALLLGWLTALPPLLEYHAAARQFQITPVKLLVGSVIIAFVLFEFSTAFSTITLDRRFLPAGGLISGFFGGLSGHQGAFRSMFLLKAGLSKEQFIATGVALAVMVDLSRLLVYGREAMVSGKSMDWLPVTVAMLSAFIGAFAGARLIRKLTIRSIRIIVSGLLITVAFGLMAGVL